MFNHVLTETYICNETWTRDAAPRATYQTPMHLYLRAIIYMGKITRGIYCFFLYDLEMLYTPDTILIALEDPSRTPLLGELLVRD